MLSPGAARGVEPVAGVLLGLLILLAFLHGSVRWFPPWPAGLVAWIAGWLLWGRASGGQRIQVLILSGLGVIGLLWGWWRGVNPDLIRVLDQNHALLAMLAAVTFLRLVSLPGSTSRQEDASGWSAYLRTLTGIHFFGAAINLSAVAIIGDRLVVNGTLDRRTGVLVSRGFSAASMWSPFFAGMAVVLTYTPDADIAVLIGVGLPLALTGLTYTFVRELLADRKHLEGFHGYPVRFESLWIPGLLAASVFLTHLLLPEWSILTTISLLAPVLSLLILGGRAGVTGVAVGIRDHVLKQLPGMYSELLLFLAAGVLAVGLSSVLSSYTDWIPFATFTGTAASVTLVTMVMLAAAGVHPVITVSVVATWLAPLKPEPTLLAMMFLMAWGIGVAASPLSATHLMMQGRYGIPGWRFFGWNLDYCLVLLLLAVGILQGYARI